MASSSSKRPRFEDGETNLPVSSSNTALFEDEGETGRRNGRLEKADEACKWWPGINEEVPFSRAGLLVTCRSGRTYFLRFLYLW